MTPNFFYRIIPIVHEKKCSQEKKLDLHRISGHFYTLPFQFGEFSFAQKFKFVALLPGYTYLQPGKNGINRKLVALALQ